MLVVRFKLQQFVRIPLKKSGKHNERAIKLNNQVCTSDVVCRQNEASSKFGGRHLPNATIVTTLQLCLNKIDGSIMVAHKGYIRYRIWPKIVGTLMATYFYFYFGLGMFFLMFLLRASSLKLPCTLSEILVGWSNSFRNILRSTSDWWRGELCPIISGTFWNQPFDIHNYCTPWLCGGERGFEVLSLALFFHSWCNYFCHFSCEQWVQHYECLPGEDENVCSSPWRQTFHNAFQRGICPFYFQRGRTTSV